MSLHYDNTEHGIFLRRVNRFVAEVQTDSGVSTVHVRNTGRCTGVIFPGAEVSLQRSADPMRKTPYTLIAVRTPEYGWVNLDSLSPNKLASEWLENQGFTEIRPEQRFGSSRIDFMAVRGGEEWLIEVKGCTLAENGTGLFPDAPTARGTKHLRELSAAAGRGFRPAIAFVIMLHGVEKVVPNSAIDPQFAGEFAKARSAGVQVFYIPCTCTASDVFLK